MSTSSSGAFEKKKGKKSTSRLRVCLTSSTSWAFERKKKKEKESLPSSRVSALQYQRKTLSSSLKTKHKNTLAPARASLSQCQSLEHSSAGKTGRKKRKQEKKMSTSRSRVSLTISPPDAFFTHIYVYSLFSLLQYRQYRRLTLSSQAIQRISLCCVDARPRHVLENFSKVKSLIHLSGKNDYNTDVWEFPPTTRQRRALAKFSNEMSARSPFYEVNLWERGLLRMTHDSHGTDTHTCTSEGACGVCGVCGVRGVWAAATRHALLFEVAVDLWWRKHVAQNPRHQLPKEMSK